MAPTIDLQGRGSKAGWKGRSRMNVVSIVPDGVVAYGIQLPVQALSTRVSMEWEREHGTVDDMVRVARGVRRGRLPLRRGLPPRRDPARARGADVDDVVRPGRDARRSSPRTPHVRG